MRKIILITLCIILILPGLSITSQSENNFISSNIEDLSYSQEIFIPIDTNLDESKFQPIDIKIEFNNRCWAIDETDNSVRVGFEKGSKINEIESQIYDLEHTDQSYIKSCGLVFLIPEEADGNEKYYVFYDSKKIDSASYKDHLNLEDKSYFYEPISGQKIFFDYYGIKEENYVIYAIIQKGELLGNPIALNVGKLKPNSKEVETNNIDQLGGFDFRYGIFESPGYYGTSWATEINKNVLVDGNLMIRVRIEAYSPDKDIKSDNIYTYYYSPTENKKIYVNANHEILNDIDIEDPELYDGTYAGIVSIKSRSATIEKMNVGEILPQIALYSEKDKIEFYHVPQNPDSEKKEAVLTTEADIDLGNKGWISLFDPELKKAHGLIMEKTKDIISGELDGVQAKAWVKQNLKLPGLEADTGSLFIFRNNYEKNKGHTTNLKKGFSVNYNIEFFTAEKESYERIDAESDLFQKLVKLIPFNLENEITKEDTSQKYSLKTFVHFASSVPQGSLFTALTGKELSYIYAEIFKENDLRSSGAVARISLLGSIELDLEGKNIFQKIQTIIKMFDWKNASLFKKIIFPDLEPGNYVIKIFRENPIFAKQRQFIGYKIVNISKDETIHIYCRPQGSINLNVVNQKNNPIKNVEFQLIDKNEIIYNSLSDLNGTAYLYAPCNPLKSYTLRVLYKGFLISEEEISFKLINRFTELKQSFEIELFDLNLIIKDTWDLPISIEVNPILTSSQMFEKTNIQAEKVESGKYIFSNLLSKEYTLSMSYKSFELDKDIDIGNTKEITLTFPAEYDVLINLKNSYGEKLTAGSITALRNEKTKNIKVDNSGKANLKLPPGKYFLTIKNDDKTIAKQEIQITGDKKLDIITNKDSIIHQFVFILGLIVAVIALFLLFYKKNFFISLKLIVIGLLVISLFSPWWVLTGEENNTTTSTNALLIPSKIVTVTQSSDAIGGEIALVPDDVTMVLGLISLILILSLIIIALSIFTKNKLRKTTILLSIISIILIILCIAIFYYAFSLITEVGVGSFIGSGSIDTTIPGIAETKIISSSWGPGLGFYLAFISIILLIVTCYYYNKKSKDFFFKSKKRIGTYQIKPYTKHRRSIEVVTNAGWKKRSTHTVLELDVTDALKKINNLKKNTKDVSFTAWVIKCVSQGLSKHKELNSLRHGKKKILIFDDVDVAVPIERTINEEHRPLVIIIRNANEKNVFEITKEIRDAQNQEVDDKSRIISKKITPLEKFALIAPTFIQKFLLWITTKNAIIKKKHMGTTGVTSIGMKGVFPGGVIPLGGTATTLFVVGGIVKKPRIFKGKIKDRSILNLTLTSDHDLVDGGPLVRFIESLTKQMQKGSFLDK